MENKDFEQLYEDIYQELNRGNYGLTPSNAHKVTLYLRKRLEAQTLPLQECYVPCEAVDGKFPDEIGRYMCLFEDLAGQVLEGSAWWNGDYFIPDNHDDYVEIEVTHWLKKLSLPIKEQEEIIEPASENNSDSVVSHSCADGNSIEQGFASLADELSEWSESTFGKRPASAPAYHLKKEVAELIEAFEKDPSNWRAIETELADCFLLVVDASKKHGLTAAGIISNARGKFEVAKKRKWGKADANGVVEHIRTEEELPNSDKNDKPSVATMPNSSTNADNINTSSISKEQEDVEALAKEKYPTEDARENMFHDNMGQLSRQKAFIAGYRAAQKEINQ
jgi:NTP pyrophosphatase (non-canonical NTP hydrolase)